MGCTRDYVHRADNRGKDDMGITALRRGAGGGGGGGGAWLGDLHATAPHVYARQILDRQGIALGLGFAIGWYRKRVSNYLGA